MSESAVARRNLIVGGAAALACAGCISPETIQGGLESVVDGPQGFGARINLGAIDEVVETIRENDGFWFLSNGRMWVVEYPAAALEQARRVYSGPELAGMEAGVVALFQKCPHLGCRVPSCATSQFFECPCHGSKYNQVGEKVSGPSPRGMDRFVVHIEDGDVIVDTAAVIRGPVIGTNTTAQEPAGAFCIGDLERDNES